MSPNKRKIFASDTSEDDNFKHRRSSLRVNLSYSDNLTDSGNGSLWKTEIENDERGANATRTSREGKNIYEKTHRSNPDNEDIRAISNVSKRAVNNDEMSVQVKEGISLKRLMINLEDISIKERYLETSCKHLKDAILCKSKQIFDGENELSKKIMMILGNEENRFASSIHNPNIGNKTVTLETTDCHLKEKATEEHEQYIDTLSSQQRKDQYSNIIATPTNSDSRRSLERTIDKSKLTQRRLFVETDKQVEEQTKCKIIEDIVLKKNYPLLSVRRINQSDSPILSGSNRRLSLVRARSRLRSQNQFESHNNTYSTVHSLQSIDIGAPVVCSTFIEDNAMNEEEINNDADASRATHTMNKIVSMEMTEVYGGIRMSEGHVSLQDRNSDTNNCNKNNKEKKSKAGSIERNKNTLSLRLENVERPINKVTVRNNTVHSDLPYSDDSNDQNVASMHIDTIIPMQVSTEEAVITKPHDIVQVHECENKIKYQNERRCTMSLSDSNNTIRSSLNVNTSLDAVTEASKARNVRKLSDYRTNDANKDFEITINNKGSLVSDDQHESGNTIRTSLQMNTSVDSMRKIWQRRSNKDRNHSSTDTKYSSITKNREMNDIDSLENISLIERLRNISMRNQTSYNVKSRVSKMKDEDKKRSSSSGDSYSFVEGTPYPISRSVLFRSQLKYKTQHLDDATNCSNNLNSMDNEENKDETKLVALHSKVSDEIHMSTETQKIMEANTVTLEDTPSGNAFVTQNQLTVIEDADETKPDGTKSETDEKTTAVQNTECAPVKKGRRKLLPLNETSQLCSITPIDENKYTSEESTSAKRHKRLKKKLPKRKSIRSKNNTSKHIASEQLWSDSDCDIPDNKKKESKKTRKPKKIVSKKILIKKFVDENMLNILQEDRQNEEDHSIENRNSLDDFVKRRNIVTISTQWNKYKSQKIVIVTTGLSKGDKSLVKSIVKSLGTAEVELNVSRRTTHVVSTGVRTVNLLRGIIRGCWLVTLEWVLKSLENNAWLDPEAFEMKHFSKAVQENRKDRQLFGPSYIPELFTACGFIHVECKTTVPCDTLKELIKTAGGHITENTKLAKIIIGANGLKETWVIDSITTGELQLTKLYQRK